MLAEKAERFVFVVLCSFLSSLSFQPFWMTTVNMTVWNFVFIFSDYFVPDKLPKFFQTQTVSQTQTNNLTNVFDCPEGSTEIFISCEAVIDIKVAHIHLYMSSTSFIYGNIFFH